MKTAFYKRSRTNKDFKVIFLLHHFLETDCKYKASIGFVHIFPQQIPVSPWYFIAPLQKFAANFSETNIVPLGFSPFLPNSLLDISPKFLRIPWTKWQSNSHFSRLLRGCVWCVARLLLVCVCTGLCLPENNLEYFTFEWHDPLIWKLKRVLMRTIRNSRKSFKQIEYSRTPFFFHFFERETGFSSTKFEPVKLISESVWHFDLYSYWKNLEHFQKTSSNSS